MHPGSENNEKFRILGYQWRVLCFNDETRQSTAKIMAAYRESDPGSVFIMQQANCLAVPCKYLHFFLDNSATVALPEEPCKFIISLLLKFLLFLFH